MVEPDRFFRGRTLHGGSFVEILLYEATAKRMNAFIRKNKGVSIRLILESS